MDSILELHSVLLPKQSYEIIDSNEKNISIKYGNSIISYVFESKNIIINPINYDGYHLLRILNSKQNLGYKLFDAFLKIPIENFNEILLELVMTLNEVISNRLYNYCTCCAKPTKLLGLNFINTCNSDICVKTINHLPTEDLISTSYQKDKTVTLTLIKFLISCAKDHPKKDLAFTPIPSILNVDNVEDFVNIIPPILSNKDVNELNKKISESENDLEIYFKLGDIAYAIIKNSLTSNYFNLISRDDVTGDNDVSYINIIYPSEIEKEFQYKQNFLFHGAGFFSWYPIMKNGLKVLSGTQLQANGAAYGRGIYMSDNLSTSYSYSRRGITYNKVVVGLFQVKEPIDKFKKAPSIFVVEDEKILLLRSLIVFNYESGKHINPTKLLNEINKYYKDSIVDIEITRRTSNLVKNKRLKKELELLEKKNYSNIKIIDELTKWEIELSGLKIQINFSSYPLNAPNLVLISGNIPSAIIDSSSNIKIPLIHPSNWNIKNNITEIFEQLEYIISNNLC